MWGSESWGEMVWGGVTVPMMSPLGLGLLAMCFIAGGVLLGNKRRTRRTSMMIAAALAVAPFVAHGAFDLPFVFANGTVADANQVNANLDSIQEDFRRLVVVTNVAEAGNAVEVAAADLSLLCGDGDGCSLQVMAQYDLGPNQSQTYFGDRLKLAYDSRSATPSYSIYDNGIFDYDANNGQRPLTSVGGQGSCSLNDFETVGGAPQLDDEAGFWLVVNSGVPSYTCTLVIDD